MSLNYIIIRHIVTCLQTIQQNTLQYSYQHKCVCVQVPCYCTKLLVAKVIQRW